MPDPSLAPITVGIVTRNRADSLARCLASLSVLGDRLAEAIVVDDTSDEPLDAAIACGPAGRVRLLRQQHREGRPDRRPQHARPGIVDRNDSPHG
jgi:glycosyltransferase involved in cell wall biosynthesis